MSNGMCSCVQGVRGPERLTHGSLWNTLLEDLTPPFLICFVLVVAVVSPSAVAYTTETSALPYSQAAGDASCWERYSASSGAGTSRQYWNADPNSWSIPIAFGGYWHDYCQATLCYKNQGVENCYYYPIIGNPAGQPACPAGFVYDGYGSKTCKKDVTAIDPPKNDGDGCVNLADPINAATGNKFDAETDIALTSLKFSRYYNSQLSDPSHVVGVLWRHSYSAKLSISQGDTLPTVFAQRPDGKTHYYSLSNGSWIGDEDDSDRLYHLANGTWQLVTRDDVTETYNAAGVLQSIADRAGRTEVLTYSDGTDGANGGSVLETSGNPTADLILPAGLLIRVTDEVGRSLSFGYDTHLRVVKVTDVNRPGF